MATQDFAVIVPPQKNPPLILTQDDGEQQAGNLDNNRLWSPQMWLFLSQLSNAVNFLLTNVSPVPPTPPVVSGHVLSTDVQLTADASIMIPAVVHGDLLVVRVEQDGTGGWVGTFPAMCTRVPPLPTTASTVSLMCFVGTAVGTWDLCGHPILGVHSGADSITPGTTGIIESIDQFFTANDTITGPSLTAGNVLVVRTLQDGTGGWTITFDSSFLYAPPMSLAAGMASIAVFFASQTGKWELCAMPIIGRPGLPASIPLTGSATLLLDEVTVFSNIIIDGPAVIGGDLLVVRVVQDSVGGWNVAMGANFAPVPAWIGRANQCRELMFFGSTSGLWEMASLGVF